jgi:hypothetical protein
MPLRVEKLFLEPRTWIGNTGIVPLQPIDQAAWIWHPDVGPGPDPGDADNPPALRAHDRTFGPAPVFLRFRRDFAANGSSLVIHVSADERFELYLDGARITRGPDRSDVEHWSYGTYEIALDAGPVTSGQRTRLHAGDHRMEALVWKVGAMAPFAQLSNRGGFILKADGEYDERLTTGKAEWKVARVDGVSMDRPADGAIFAVGGEITVADGFWSDSDFSEAKVVRGIVGECRTGEPAPGWKLFPSTLPDMIDREARPGRIVAAGDGGLGNDDPVTEEHTRHPDIPRWQALVEGKGEVVVPAGSEVFVLWDLDDYYCAQPVCEFSGGSGGRIAWGWAEALYEPGSRAKGNRDKFVGKTFNGLSDSCLPDGGDGRRFTTHWWRAGRYCLLEAKAGETPLTIRRLSLDETRYPLENEGTFDCGDEEVGPITRVAVRGLQMCSHETFMDCPYYEQLMYVGDTRLEMLTTYVVTRDDRLVRRGIELFDHSRRNWGFVNERYPSHIPQLSTTFSMIWALVLRDYAFWRDDPAWVRDRMVGLRSMLEHFQPYFNDDGLLEALPGWSFMDWVPAWDCGHAPDGWKGVSAVNNLLFVLAMQSAAELEDAMQEPLLARRDRETASRVAEAVITGFWDEGRGLVADNLAHTEFSEHAQCLALLSDAVSGDRAERVFAGLLGEPDLSRTTVYFSFYLLETFRRFGRGDLIVRRLDFWKSMVANGLRTPIEAPEPSRSDCHAWASHPLFHLHASVAGVRPSSPGFKTVRIAPQPGPLPRIRSRLPHPDGFVQLDLAFKGGSCRGTIELPAGVTGAFLWRGQEVDLAGGENDIELAER